MPEEYDLEVSEATLLEGFEPIRFVVGGVPVRAYAGGDGPPVVLVHGLGGAAANWTLLAPLLARRHRVLVPELPGHGGSAPSPAPEGLGSIADLLAELAELAGMPRAAWVGHSLGADLVLSLALRRPHAVSALVLAAPGALASSRPHGRLWLRAWGTLRLSRVGARYRLPLARRKRLRRGAFGRWGAADPGRLSPVGALGILEGTRHSTDTATAREALIADDPRLDLAGLRPPTRLLWGARDATTPLGDGFEYARRLGAPIRTLPDTGHLLIVERPAECAELIEAFLDGGGAGGA
jgi:pimeloyl-ACP methyl ester carboxylesterase